MESMFNILQEVISLIVLVLVMYSRQKGLFKKIFESFPDKTYFYKLNARLELVEMNLSTLQRLVMKYHDVVSHDIKPSGKEIAIQQMKQTQRS